MFSYGYLLSVYFVPKIYYKKQQIILFRLIFIEIGMTKKRLSDSAWDCMAGESVYCRVFVWRSISKIPTTSLF